MTGCKPRTGKQALRGNGPGMGGVFGTSGRKLLLFLRGALLYRCLCFSIKEDLGLKEMDGTLFSWDGAEYSDLAMPVEATRAWHWGRVRFCVYTKQALCFVPNIMGDDRRCRSAAETENCSGLLLMGDGISRGVGSKITQHTTYLPFRPTHSYVGSALLQIGRLSMCRVGPF